MSKKKIIVILVICFIILVDIVVLTRSKSYSLEYDIDGLKVKETYKSDLKSYYFSVTKDNNLYEFGYNSKYKGKKLVKNIKLLEKNNNYCMQLEGTKLNVNPICYSDGQFISYNLIGDEDLLGLYEYQTYENKEKDYDEFHIKNFYNKSYAIWNGKGYTLLNNNKKKDINFLEEEQYYDNLSYQVGKYILIPDYNQKYEFDKFYILNLDNGKLKEWKLEHKLSFNIYYLGVHKNKLYLVDRKTSTEYELNIKKRKIENVTNKDKEGIVWSNGWKEVSMVKLINEDYSFTNDTLYNFQLVDGKLNFKFYKGVNNILISNKNVDKIVYMGVDEVYYLSNGALYVYNFKYGEVELISYSEWNFNKENPIYIY